MFEFLLFSMMYGEYGTNPEYVNLTEEEKKDLDYFDECYNSPNKNIRDASFYMSMLLLEASAKMDTDEEITPEELSKRKAKIYKNLNEEEIDIIEKFIPACINSMGVYSEEAKEERQKVKEQQHN